MTPKMTRQANALRLTEEVDAHRRRLIKGGLAASFAAGFGSVALTACGGSDDNAADTWTPKRTVLVILENSSFQDLVDSADMSYLKELADAGALMTNSYAAPTPYGIVPAGGPFGATPPTAFVHPLPARGSQTNYFYQFAGHNQGFLPDWFQSPGSGRLGTAYADPYGNTLPAAVANTEIGLSNEYVPDYLPPSKRPFTTPNLGAALIQHGHTYATFSESLPHPLFDAKLYNPVGVTDGYARRHNPGINWINFPSLNTTVPADKQRFLLPVSSNLALAATVDPDGNKYPGFGVDKDGNPVGFDALPTVSVVVPNNMNNRHTGSKSACDAWLRTYIKPFADWARANDSLLIVTTDEDGFTDGSNGSTNVSMDALIKKAYPSSTGSYMYGLDRITTLFHGPSGRVKTGRYTRRIDHLNILSTVLAMYGALDTFRADFAARHGATTDEVRALEARNMVANLTVVGDFLA